MRWIRNALANTIKKDGEKRWAQWVSRVRRDLLRTFSTSCGPIVSFLPLHPSGIYTFHYSISALMMRISPCWRGREASIRNQCPEYNTDTVLAKASIAVKRYHDHGNSYKWKHLTGAGLQFRGLLFIVIEGIMAVCKQIWCWRGTENPISRTTGRRKREWALAHFWTSKSTLSDTFSPKRPYLLQQSYIS